MLEQESRRCNTIRIPEGTSPTSVSTDVYRRFAVQADQFSRYLNQDQGAGQCPVLALKGHRCKLNAIFDNVQVLPGGKTFSLLHQLSEPRASNIRSSNRSWHPSKLGEASLHGQNASQYVSHDFGVFPRVHPAVASGDMSLGASFYSQRHGAAFFLAGMGGGGGMSTKLSMVKMKGTAKAKVLWKVGVNNTEGQKGVLRVRGSRVYAGR